MSKLFRSNQTVFRALEDDGKMYIEGYFAVFGSVYQIWSDFSEDIDPHAFDDSVGGDIRALTDHKSELVLARTKAGTLTLRVDDHGLWGRLEINPADQDAVNLYARVQRHDVDQCSFGCYIEEENFRYDYRADGSIHRTIMKAELFEVSVCTFPAYEDTAVQARNREEAEIIKVQRFKAWHDQILRRIKNA